MLPEPPVSASPTQSPAAEADCWPGLDIAFGMNLVANKLALYRKLLCCYRDSTAASSQSIDAALATGDASRIDCLVHTLKGNSGALGMPGVYAAAIALEGADRELDPARWGQLLNTLKAEQAQVLGSIERYLAGASPSQTPSPGASAGNEAGDPRGNPGA